MFFDASSGPKPYQAELAAMQEAVLAAGSLLLHMRHRPQTATSAWRKEDQSWVSEADHAAATLIDAALHSAFPDAALLNEETYLQHRASVDWRLAHRCFVIDPLDSTSSFLRGHPHYGVIVALCEGGEPVAGVTYKPELGELYVAARGQGAWRTFADTHDKADTPQAWLRVHVAKSQSISLVTSHGRVTPGLQDLLHRLGQPPSQRMSGSLKINEVARGEYTAFISPAENPMGLWDIAAPSLILTEAGGQLTDLAGMPIDWRQVEPILRCGLIASNSLVHETLIKRLAKDLP